VVYRFRIKIANDFCIDCLTFRSYNIFTYTIIIFTSFLYGFNYHASTIPQEEVVMGGLYLFAGALAIGLLLYLIAVLLNPEKFS
jgi:K+-transporting ATPase KdpF subunit